MHTYACIDLASFVKRTQVGEEGNMFYFEEEKNYLSNSGKEEKKA